MVVENTCILNKNEDCALNKLCSKIELNNICKSKLKNTKYCRDKCVLRKFQLRSECNKFNVQNNIYKMMEYQPWTYYDAHKSRFPNRFPKPHIPTPESLKLWNYYNKLWYERWIRRFASQNGPTVDGWPATQLTGDNGHIPYTHTDIYNYIQKTGNIGFENTGCCCKKYPDCLRNYSTCKKPERCYCKCNQVWKSASRKKYN